MYRDIEVNEKEIRYDTELESSHFSQILFSKIRAMIDKSKKLSKVLRTSVKQSVKEYDRSIRPSNFVLHNNK